MMDFYRIAHQTITSGLVVRYKEVGPPGGLEVSASRDGVMIGGYSPTMKSLVDLIDVLGRAASWHHAIKSKDLRSSDVDAVGLEEEPSCVVETRKAHFVGDDEVLARREVDSEGECEAS